MVPDDIEGHAHGRTFTSLLYCTRWQKGLFLRLIFVESFVSRNHFSFVAGTLEDTPPTRANHDDDDDSNRKNTE